MKKRFLYLVNLLLVLVFLLAGQQVPVHAESETPTAVVITWDGPLTPVWGGYLKRGINQAVNTGADILVIELNTPGGSIDLMNDLIADILASPVPVAVYVTPRGAMAASAGTMLVLAGQVAAMTPESAIGAASPVGMQGEDIESTEETKTKEILKASVRSLAKRRGEEAVALAEAAIESAKAASSSEALDAGLIDYIAPDLENLLIQMDGRTVVVSDQEVILHTKGANLIRVKTSFIEDILGLLTNPNIVFLLLSVGVQAILIEISSPGGWAAGTIGIILIALAIYGLGILPVNWFGIVFLILAFILFILDIKAPTHGALTAAGTASFIAGALVLFNTVTTPGFPKVSVGLVIGTGVVLGLTFFGVVMIAVRALKKPIITGRESMAGKSGVSVTDIDPHGIVQVAGEQWSASLAESAKPIKKGSRVVVVRVEGVRLIVREE
ncbi:MAG: nodulation protein NfeD [Anaerolineaceae bacterium]|nr:nodulation protein NfeD [Anaerolineaceae bacterium]